MDANAELVPETSRQEYPPLRVLVIGKSGVGKSALINAVFGVDATDVSHHGSGVHDINKPLTYPSNDRIIIHDSQGFEAGEKDNLKKVKDFIEQRSNAPSLAERLHAIWVCAEIPISGARLFETGVERILKGISQHRSASDLVSSCIGANGSSAVPITIVFTKIDLLFLHIEGEVDKEFGDDLDDTELDEKVEVLVKDAIQKRCVQPLHALSSPDGPQLTWVVTSTSKEPKYKETVRNLVDQALTTIGSEDIQIGLSIAQRVNAQVSIAASIKIGRKRYWRGLFADILFGYSMRRLINVLHRDIINVWNMEDRTGYLLKPDFLALMSVLVEDLWDEITIGPDYRWTEKALEGALQNPSSLIIAGPTTVIILFAEWVYNAYRQTKSSLRCMIAYIIDLTLTMDTLFHLHLSQKPKQRGQVSISIKLINEALVMYNARKAPVHASIRAWVDRWGSFSHLNVDKMINAIDGIIHDHCVNPETWSTNAAEKDEIWISADKLRGV